MTKKEKKIFGALVGVLAVMLSAVFEIFSDDQATGWDFFVAGSILVCMFWMTLSALLPVWVRKRREACSADT